MAELEKMETEYITKQEAIKAVCDSCGVMPDGEKDTCLYKYEGVGCREYDKIVNISPADVRPVIRGRWINEERVGFGSVEAECSNCGRRMIYNPAWICCPWCVADMQGGDAE